MKKSRFTEEQIAFALKQAETGTPVSAAARSRSGADARQVWLLPNLILLWREGWLVNHKRV